jgi:hypothetical protein
VHNPRRTFALQVFAGSLNGIGVTHQPFKMAFKLMGANQPLFRVDV